MNQEQVVFFLCCMRGLLMRHLVNTIVILLVVLHLGDIETLLMLVLVLDRRTMLGLHLLGQGLSTPWTGKERRVRVRKRGGVAVFGEDVE